MKFTTMQPNPGERTMYKEPQVCILYFSRADMMNTSENGDGNQGEWDPQGVNDIFEIGEN